MNMPDLLAPTPTVGQLYENPGATFSPRVGAAWNIGGNDRTSLRGGYGLYYTVNNQQELIVTVTNPPATPRVVIAAPTFPVPPFERAGGISVRPIQYDIQYPRVHIWNVSLQRTLPADWVASIGYAGSRGRHLWRNADVNVPAPVVLDDGPFYPAGLTRPNPAFSAIELKSSDGDSWYKALILEAHRQWNRGLQVQTSYTWSKTEDTTQNATFFSDSTTSLVSAMPEVIPDYNKGLVGLPHRAQLRAERDLADPHAASTAAALAGAMFNDWQVAGIVRMRSGNPLTVFVQTNRSRSLWAPSLGPGTGPDRPSYAPGRGPDDAVTGDPDAWFDPTAFVLQPAGRLGTWAATI